jgi:Kelch motif
MAELDIKAKITGSLKIGPNPPSKSNELTLEITNSGAEILKGSKVLYFYLTGTLGLSAEDLFLDQAEATNCEPSYPSSDWQGTWTCRADKTFSLPTYSSGDVILKARETVKITFPGVISNTGPGQAKLRFGFGFGKDKMKDCGELLIDKSPDKKEIIAFYSNPSPGSGILPGGSVTLKWRTNGMTDLKLVQKTDGSTKSLRIGDNNDEGEYRADGIATTVTFKLSGQPSDERDLTIKVLTPGWKEKINYVSIGDPVFPKPANQQEATDLKKKGFPLDVIQLFNANDVLLYAVFRYTYREQEIAFLASTDNPFAPWSTVESEVPEQDSWIPSGFATSPGVYFKDHIWLVGGSQIDPDNTSNIVWRLDPKKKVWQKVGAALWPSRMGHAVLVFQNKIWVMGGRDPSGNALNDVWACDGESGNWTRVSQETLWEPRCLCYPTVWNKEIWLYGGASAPFSSKLFKDLWSSADGKKWEQRKLTNILGADEGPVASCLVVFKDQLVLLGKFLSIDPAEGSDIVIPKAFRLKGRSTNTWESFSDDGLKGWGSDNTSSFQMVNFRNEMLIGKALAYDEPNTALKIHIPQS